MKKDWDMAQRGLALPPRALSRLSTVGIFAQSQVSLEHQNLAKRYVIRGVESGGAIQEIGRYVTFTGNDGEQLEHLHPMDAIGVNGVHAVVLACALVRIEIFRAGRSYRLLITRHHPKVVANGRRPPLESIVLFHGVEGYLDLELWGVDRSKAGSVLPCFYSRSGEPLAIPESFVPGVKAAVHGVACVGCSHSHFLVPRQAAVEVAGSSS